VDAADRARRPARARQHGAGPGAARGSGRERRRLPPVVSLESPCLSFGRNEPALARYDRARIAARGLAVVRRPTGGRAVWHEHEVTYAVAAPIAQFGTLAESYCDIHARLARALGTLGLDARLAPAGPSAPLGAGACFRGERRGRSARGWTQGRGLGAGAPRHGVPAARLDPAGRVAGRCESRQSSAVGRQRNDTGAGAGPAGHVRRGGGRDRRRLGRAAGYRPLPPPTVSYRPFLRPSWIWRR